MSWTERQDVLFIQQPYEYNTVAHVRGRVSSLSLVTGWNRFIFSIIMIRRHMYITYIVEYKCTLSTGRHVTTTVAVHKEAGSRTTG